MPYGRQYMGTRNDPRLRPDQVAAVNAQLAFLPERIAQQRAEQQHQDQVDYWNRSLAQQKDIFRKQQAQAEAEQRSAMGLEGAKLGLNIAMNPAAHGSISDKLSGAIKPLFGGGSKSFDASADAKNLTGQISGGDTGNGIFSSLQNLGGSVKNFLGGLNFANTIGAGLAGFGASRFLGDAAPWKKGLVGAGVGGLMSLLTGESGKGVSNAISGSIFGGLGSLF